MTTPLQLPPGVQMFWLVYNDDWSRLSTFRDELKARREAMKTGMKTAPVRFSRDLREQVTAYEASENEVPE